MKPYFTKYIEVEGEIKDGDKAIDYNILSENKLVSITINKYGYGSDGRGDYSPEGLKKLKKVKLFLCSREVKIGDTVKLINGSNNDYDIKFEDEIGKDLWYKVIGEVSPEAIWVKEGMEFGEDEVHRCFVHESISNLSDPMVRRVQLKGPCGHFH